MSYEFKFHMFYLFRISLRKDGRIAIDYLSFRYTLFSMFECLYLLENAALNFQLQFKRTPTRNNGEILVLALFPQRAGWVHAVLS